VVVAHALDSHPLLFRFDALIVSNPDTLGGKPRIAGRRIAVVHIKNWHLRHGMTPQQIAGEYDLPLEAVHAALAYHYAHRAEVDARDEAEDARIDALMQETDAARGVDHPAGHLQKLLNTRRVTG
jgi:uncharacterized protein (DUF433 family)